MSLLILPITPEQYERAGTKFITFSSYDAVGKCYYKEIVCLKPDWDNPGISIQFPIRIIGPMYDPDIGKQFKLSCGVAIDAIWKLKNTLNSLSIKVHYQEVSPNQIYPVFDSDEVEGKEGMGCWEIQEGYKGGDPTRGITKYPSLVSIHPVGYTPPLVGFTRDHPVRFFRN